MKPAFRRRLDTRVGTMAQPIPLVWAAVNGAHHAMSFGITAVQEAHFAVRDNVMLNAATMLGASPDTVHSFRARHTRFFNRVYDTLRTAHWYV